MSHYTSGGRLTEALEDLDDHGGLSAVRAAMKPASAEKLAAALELVRSLADHQLATLSGPMTPGDPTS
jgi:hypothetical protein